jgi:hypothetical protein
MIEGADVIAQSLWKRGTRPLAACTLLAIICNMCAAIDQRCKGMAWLQLVLQVILPAGTRQRPCCDDLLLTATSGLYEGSVTLCAAD